MAAIDPKETLDRTYFDISALLVLGMSEKLN